MYLDLEEDSDLDRDLDLVDPLDSDLEDLDEWLDTLRFLAGEDRSDCSFILTVFFFLLFDGVGFLGRDEIELLRDLLSDDTSDMVVEL